MEILNKLEIKNDIFIPDDGGALFFVKPIILEQLPSIDSSLINDKYLQLATPEIILAYFEELLDEDIRVKVINGIHIIDYCSSYYCDYCKTRISDNWFYCNHCNKDMCKCCHEETSEEIAIKNGAKNYKVREADLNKCRSCKLIEPRNIYNIVIPGASCCDLCNEHIVDSNFYSTKLKETNSSYDICENCYQISVEVRNIVETKSMILIDINDKSNYYFGYTGFGSMLYWFPIIYDTDECCVLMNLNPEDPNYGKICLKGCDSHGRFGYFIIRDEKYDLHKVLERLKEICDKGTFEYTYIKYIEEEEIVKENDDLTEYKGETVKNGKYEWVTNIRDLCSTHYSSPIHILMQELNMPVNYG